ncbi:MAG: hypothetical protein WD772_06955 [Pseudohongiellaceae bacterium]
MSARSVLLIVFAATLMSCTANEWNSFNNLQMPGTVNNEDIPADIKPDSWARLPLVNRADLDAESQRVYDMMTSPGNGYENGLRGPLAMWIYSPQMADGAWMLRQRVRYGTAKDQRLTELTIISTAREISNQYEYTAHEPLGMAAGLEQEIMDFVKYRRPLSEADGIPGMGETEKLIIRFTRELISEPKVSSEVFAELLTMMGEEGVMDLVGLIGYYHFVGMTLKAFDVQQAPGTRLLMPMAAP